MADVEAQTTYARSDGGYCTEIELWERLEAGEWTPCCWDPESGEEWVETDDGDLIALVPVADETPQPV